MLKKTIPCWLWLNVLSLDAPLVAVVWQDLLARNYGTALISAERTALFLSVWAIYLADRMIDVRRAGLGDQTPRHSFCRQNGAFARILLASVMVADTLDVLVWLPFRIVAGGLTVGAVVIVYLAFFPFKRFRQAGWKQPSAAVLFTIGVFLTTWLQTSGARVLLIGPALVFCALCLANMVLIERWEQAESSLKKSWFKNTFAWVIFLAVVCLAAGHSQWYRAVGGAALALAAVDYAGTRIPRDAGGVLADLALLTPLLIR